MKKSLGQIQTSSILRCLLPCLTAFAVSAAAQGTEAPSSGPTGRDDPNPAHVISPDDLTTSGQDAESFTESLNSPLFLAVFGDSVTMATMADAEFGRPGPRFYADFIGSGALAALFTNFVVPHRPDLTEEDQHELIGKLFGNMTRKSLSPFMGTQDYSLPVLLKEKTGFTPKVYNGAQLAGSYYFSKLYLDKFERFFERNPFHKKPDIIIVNFNGMDMIENRGPKIFAEKIHEFYRRLTLLAPASKLVITGLADPVALLTYPDRVAIPNSPAGPVKCSDLYKFLRFGNGLGLYPGAPQSNKDSARVILSQLRDILAHEIDLMNNDRKVYPHFTGQAYFMAPEDRGDVSAEMIAADCIHPNRQAQREIGQSFWEFLAPVL